MYYEFLQQDESLGWPQTGYGVQAVRKNGKRIEIPVLPQTNVLIIGTSGYGTKIAVTRAALQACDDGTLLAVLGHEASHHLHGDAPFHRLLFANAILLLAVLSISSFVAISLLWILFLILCAVGVCGGLCSACLFRGTNSLIKGLFTGCLLYTSPSLVNPGRSRSHSDRADSFWNCFANFNQYWQFFYQLFFD